MKITCEDILSSYYQYLSDNFTCYPEGNYIAIETPYLYSDGDVIYFYLEQRGEEVRLTDLGETIRRLAIYNINWNSSRIQSLFSKILNRTGISSTRGVLVTKVLPGDNLADLVSDLVQAIQQIDDLVFTLKDYVPKSFRDEVETFLRKERFVPELNFRIEGHSGTQWRVHFFMNHRKNVLLKAISASTRGGARYQAAVTYTMYDDIKKKYSYFRRAAILDDSIREIWDPEMLNLINAVLDLRLVYWEERQLLTEQIHALEKE